MKANGTMSLGSRTWRVVISLVLALTFAATIGVFAQTAHADEAKTFQNDWLMNRTWLTGVTQAEIEQAFETEATRVKGEMSDPSQFQIINHPLGNGWPGNGNATYFVAAHINLGTEYGGSGPWNSGQIFMVYNPHKNAVYTVRRMFANGYANSANGWTNQIIHLGYPTGNDFTVNDHSYQNFTLGYVKDDGTVVYGKYADTDGTEKDLTADMIAENMVIPVFEDASSAAWTVGLSVDDFVDAYKAYYAEKPINTGAMSSLTDRKNSQWRQAVDGGEVVFNRARKALFTVKTFLDGYNGTTDWGDPVAEEVTIKETVSQLFSNGVVVNEAEGAKFYPASHVDPETGEVKSDFDTDAVGNMTDDTKGKLPQGADAAALTAAVKAAWTQEAFGLPTTNLEFDVGTYLVQSFSKPDAEDPAVNKVSKIYIDAAAKTPVAAVVKSETYELYKLPVRFNEGNKKYDVTGEMILGPAIGSEFSVGEKTYQNFLYGAMELTAAKEENIVLPGVNYAADGTRTVLDLSDQIKIDVEAARIPNSYKVSAADLLPKFKAAYKAFVEQGVALGVPNKEGIGAWPAEEGGQIEGTNEFKDGQGMIKLGLHATDSTGICYYGVTAMLAYCPDDGNVYLMSDSVMSNMATYYSVYGAPRCNLTDTVRIVDGQEVAIKIQNFELGYLVVMGSSASMVPDQNWDFELQGPVNVDGSKIPGTEYPGETAGGGDNPGNDDKKDGCGKGCGGLVTGGGLFLATFALGGAAVLARRRRSH